MANVIVERKPRSRGVTQLMYVGDDDAVENATMPTWVAPVKAAGIALLAYAALAPKTSKNRRLGMAGAGGLAVMFASGWFFA